MGGRVVEVALAEGDSILFEVEVEVEVGDATDEPALRDRYGPAPHPPRSPDAPSPPGDDGR
jgi:hypothetical protein